MDVQWELLKAEEVWAPLDPEIGQYIEGEYQKGASFADFNVAVAGGLCLFRIHLYGMFHEDLTSKEVTKLRRTTNNPTNLVDEARRCLQWETIHSATDTKIEGGDTCSLCLEDFSFAPGSDPIIKLPKCGSHYFHEGCIAQCFGGKGPTDGLESSGHLTCPLCSHIYGSRTGTMPYGTMNIHREGRSLPSFECGTITINYCFPSGIQGPEHPSPGNTYAGTTRSCYLPDNEEGQQILKMLKIAFARRLTFVVGTSLTTNRGNSVVWGTIHHKTNRTGGAERFGFPDATYFERVTKELAGVGVFPDTPLPPNIPSISDLIDSSPMLQEEELLLPELMKIDALGKRGKTPSQEDPPLKK